MIFGDCCDSVLGDSYILLSTLLSLAGFILTLVTARLVTHGREIHVENARLLVILLGASILTALVAGFRQMQGIGPDEVSFAGSAYRVTLIALRVMVDLGLWRIIWRETA